MKTVAIVTPWYGKDLKGGAEQVAWQVATRLAARGHQIEVLTTCCKSFLEDWSVNHLPQGKTIEENVVIRRFPVSSRDDIAFDRLNQRLLDFSPEDLLPGVHPVSREESAIFAKHNMNSESLLTHLKENIHNYHVYLFIPYLYGPILNGLPLVSQRAILQPCLHNEVYAYLPEIANIFHLANRLLFNSQGEMVLSKQLYGPGVIPKSTVVKLGIEFQNVRPDFNNLPDCIKDKQYVLCLGRRDSTKNTVFLIQAFSEYKYRNPNSDLMLVFAGPGTASYHKKEMDIIDLGLVSNSEKEALLHHCLALLIPSKNESFSRVMMEAWHCRRPVVAHRDCLATAEAVRAARGGLVAGELEEWIAVILALETEPQAKMVQYGQNGYDYAVSHADWDRVIQRYEKILGLNNEHSRKKSKRTNNQLTQIHQLLPNLAYGDAISNHAMNIRDHLQSMGCDSEIFVGNSCRKVTNECKIIWEENLNDKAGMLYHHSIGSDVTDYAVKHPGPKCLIYHNITPAKYVRPYRPEFAKLLEKGRNDIGLLAKTFAISVGDSGFNAKELEKKGFKHPGVLPIAVSPNKWDHNPDGNLMRQLQDGKRNLLFVGRIAPNKCQCHLIKAFCHYLTMDSNARLILVGWGESDDPYVRHVHCLAEQENIKNHVILPGQVNDAQLSAYYRTAHLFWSMSEHEGFCVPLIEAMWHDVPILAYKSSAIPETLGDAGIMFTSKSDLVSVAALAKIMAADAPLREKIIKAQRIRRTNYLPSVLKPKLENIITLMEKT